MPNDSQAKTTTAVGANGRTRKGWTPATMDRHGVYADDNGRFVFQLEADDGTLVGVARYADDGRKPKMLVAKRDTRELWPRPEAVPGATLYVVEGEPDSLTMAELDLPAVGFPGVGKASPDWPRRVVFGPGGRRERVVFVPDCDDGGRKKARGFAGEVSALGVPGFVAELDPSRHDGFDVGDLLIDALEYDPENGHELARRIVEARVAEAKEVPSSDSDGATPATDDEATSVGRIRRALFVDTDDTREGATAPRDPVPGTGELLWKGLAHTFYGDRGEGKSVVVLTVSVSAAVAGERVLYLDRENGAALTRSWVAGILSAHGDWPDVLEAGNWVGRHYPEFSREWLPADYAEAVGGLGYTGVIYDNVREVLSELGGNPNSDEDYSALQRILVTPLLRRGTWVVVLDNVGHLEKQRPKGTGAKVDAVPTGYQVRTTKKFTPTLLGAVEVKCLRSRYGDVGRAWTAEIGAGRFDVPKPREAVTDDAVDPVAVVVAALEVEAPLGLRKLEDALRAAGVKGKSEVLRDQIKTMASDPDCRVHDTGNGYALNPEDPVSRPRVPTPWPCPSKELDTAGSPGHADDGRGELLPPDDDPEGGDA